MRDLFTFLRLPAACLCLGLLAACQTMSGPGLIESEVSAQLSPDAASAIAQDMVGQLAEHIGPGNTTIALRGNDAIFGPALEAALRTQGYAVVTNQAIDGTTIEPLAYSVNPFEGGLLVRISTLKVELTQMYTLEANGAEPASPLSVMQRGPAA